MRASLHSLCYTQVPAGDISLCCCSEEREFGSVLFSLPLSCLLVLKENASRRWRPQADGDFRVPGFIQGNGR